jgi:hypothetical protein
MLILFKLILYDYCAGNHSGINCHMKNPSALLNSNKVNYISNFQY